MHKILAVCCISLCTITEVWADTYTDMQQECIKIAMENPPQVEVKYNYGQLKINNELDEKQLQKFHYEMTRETAENLNGLTSLQPSIVLNGLNNMDVRELPNGYLCLFPTTLKVKIEYMPVVYILKDIAKGTCKYNMTLRHEYTHIDIAYAAMNLVVMAFRKQLPAIAFRTSVKAVLPEDAVNVSTQMNEQYQAQASQIWDLFRRVLDEQHKKLDVHDIYARETAMCK